MSVSLDRDQVSVEPLILASSYELRDGSLILSDSDVEVYQSFFR